MADADQSSLKRAPAGFFALGYGSLPQNMTVDGRTYGIVKIFKHDFFAATGLYEQTGGNAAADGRKPKLAVLKMQRTYPLYGLPMQWLGQIVARHEISVFQKLQGIAGIPEFLGEYGRTGYMHEFIPGVDLCPECRPGGPFFDRLKVLMTEIHARGVAYVDTNKRENILFGSDQHPWLIDFQISFQCKGITNNFIGRFILKRLQHEDWYHYYKHKTRLAPDICSQEDFDRAGNRSWYIRLHRRIAQPIIHWRRRFLARYQDAARKPH